MTTTIYHFSATGNSLKLARDIAGHLEDVRLVPIAGSLRTGATRCTTDRIGLVFPVFAWGLPRIVAEFARRLQAEGNPYVFAVATCVAIPGGTLVELRNLLRRNGIALHAGFSVSAARSSLMKLNGFDRVMIALDRKRASIRSGQERIHEIVAAIQDLKPHRPETSSPLANAIGSLVHGLALKSFRTIDSSFVVGNSCKGCGNCAKVCPRSNIEILEGRPVFRHDCEFCHACIQWCPNFAIRHPGFDDDPRQYRNPAVRIGEIASCAATEAHRSEQPDRTPGACRMLSLDAEQHVSPRGDQRAPLLPRCFTRRTIA